MQHGDLMLPLRVVGHSNFTSGVYVINTRWSSNVILYDIFSNLKRINNKTNETIAHHSAAFLACPNMFCKLQGFRMP